MKNFRKIALLLDTSTSWGSEIARGVFQYSLRKNWHLIFQPRGRYEVQKLPANWQGDGVIARVTNEEIANDILDSKLPAVNVSWFDFSAPNIVRCTVDESAVGRMAYEHLRDRGVRQFGYCGSLGRGQYIDGVKVAFEEAVRADGFPFFVYQSTANELGPLVWQQETENQQRWLRTLPMPIGIVAYDSPRAMQVSQACESIELSIPQDVVLMAGEHDSLFSELGRPAITAIEHSAYRVGVESADMLERMMRGEKPAAKLSLPPSGVISRPSTDTVATNDPELAAAIRYIRSHAHHPITVADIAQRSELSRRELERRFKNELGHGPAVEIRRARMDMAKRMLADTDMSVAEIATACGFEYAETLTRLCAKQLGATPSEYRKQVFRRPVKG